MGGCCCYSLGVFSFFLVVVGIGVFEECSLLVTDVECLGVGFGLVGGGIFDLGGDFVAVVVKVEVEDLDLAVKTVARQVWGCFGGNMYFLRQLSLMSVEGKMSNVGGHLCGMAIRACF